MKIGRYLYAATILMAVVVAVGIWNPFPNVAKADKPHATRFAVDPFWPKPLPDNWVTGEVAGTCLDSRDHLFIVTRGFQTGGLVSPEGIAGQPTKSKASPPVIEFDRDGKVVNSWGDPSLVPAGQPNAGQNAVLPNGIHGCFVDHEDNVWIGGNGDGVVQKWSHDGKQMLLQIGEKFKCDWPGNSDACGNSGADPDANKSTTLLNEPADIAVDPNKDPVTGKRGSVYIADGYGNHRVVVFNSDGKFLRQWGSSGIGPGQFQPGDGGHPHCVVIGNDGLVYVCDRGSDRIQVFDKVGNLKRIIPVVPCTGASGTAVCTGTGLGTAGSAWDVDFSPDKKQIFMYEVDGGNEVLWTFDRVLGKILSGFGRPGHMAGDFTLLQSVAVDSKGNLYTGETINGRRVQKFTKLDDNEDNDHDQDRDNNHDRDKD